MQTEIDYSKSKIYKIEVQNGDVECDTVYIGSTTKELGYRMSIHKSHYKYWKDGKTNKVMSFELFDDYDVDNCEIVLIENYPCKSKEELLAREGYYQKMYKCNNKNVAGAFLSLGKQAYKKLYKSNNNEVTKAYDKAYYKEHKEHLNFKYICLCGGSYMKCHTSRHNKTKKHQNYLNEV